MNFDNQEYRVKDQNYLKDLKMEPVKKNSFLTLNHIATYLA